MVYGVQNTDIILENKCTRCELLSFEEIVKLVKSVGWEVCGFRVTGTQILERAVDCF